MRKNIKKGERFDILKRDLFTCQYCGRKPPAVILHVDHILAVVLGGQNTDDNLITACADCNLGKSDKPLDRIKAPITFDLGDRQERLDQLKAYQAYLAEQARIKEEWVNEICACWAVHDGQKADAVQWSLPRELEDAARKFVSMLPLQEILDSIAIAFGRFPRAQGNYQFKFFCGIVWKKYRESQAKIQPK